MRHARGIPAAILVLAAGPAAAEDFSFLHASDTHSPMEGSGKTVPSIASLGAIEMTPFGITAPKPTFAIVSGDLTEFGDFENAWDLMTGWWKKAGLPVYFIEGNHDNTWRCIRPKIRKLYGRAYYSFDPGGWHFLAIDSATPQDPRPSYGEEEILWVREDLKKVDPKTPLCVFMHHTIHSPEFASDYDGDRLLDALRDHNLALILYGHGHNAVGGHQGGVPSAEGGSTFCARSQVKTEGFNVIDIRDGTIRIAYKTIHEAAATKKLVEAKIPDGPAYPAIGIVAPAFRAEVRGAEIRIAATVAGGRHAIQSASFTIDDEKRGEGELQKDADPSAKAGSRSGTETESTWTGAFPVPSDFEAGAHYLRVTFKGHGTFTRSGCFYYEEKGPKVLWRAFLGGSSKTTPAVTKDRVYAGANDGKVYALDRATGKILWTFDAGGEVLASPLAAKDHVYAAGGDGKVFALDLSGRPVWSFDAGDSVYASPVLDGKGRLLFGTNGSTFFSVDAGTGKEAWRFEEPAYTIESAAAVHDGAAVFGCWDQKVYAVDAATGKKRWDCVGAGAADAKAAKRYYSPGDSVPAFAGSNVFIADRAFTCSILEAATGRMAGKIPKVSAVAPSADGRHVYLRRSDDAGNLTKVDAEGKTVWATPCGMNILPAAPTEADGVVYVCSPTGLVSALDAKDGRILSQYRATPRLYVFGSVAARDGIAYVAGNDGSVTAVKMVE